MLRLLIISILGIFLSTIFQTFAQTNYNNWAKLYEEPRSDVLHYLLPLPDGDMILGGWTNADVTFGENILLMRINQNGDILWQSSIGGSELDYAQVLARCIDYNIIVGGHTRSFGAGSTDIFLLKVDQNGNIIWQKAYGTFDDNAIATLIPTDDGGFIVGGWSYLGAGKSHDALIFKTDSKGNIIWQKHYGTENYEGIRDIIKSTDGNYIFVGLTSSEQTQFDILVAKIDTNGNIIWKKSIAGPRYENPVNIVNNNGTYLIIGTSDSFSPDSSKDIFVIAMDNDGNFLWGLNYPDNFETSLISSCKLEPNKILTIGNAHPKTSWISDMLVAIFNYDGEFINGKLFGGIDNELGYAITPYRINSILAGGYSYSFSNGNSDILLISTDESLSLPPGEVQTRDFILTSKPFNIHPNIKNPDITVDTSSILIISEVEFTTSNPNLTSRNLNFISSVETCEKSRKITVRTTSNGIYIDLSSELPPRATIKISNLLGQEILNVSFTNQRHICVSTSNFNPGIYFIYIDEYNFGIPFLVY